MSTLNKIVHDIELQTQTTLTNYTLTPIGGGCINTAYKLQTENTSLFIKINQASLLSMFEAEAQGLHELKSLKAVTVPSVICFGIAGNESYLAMEYLELGSQQTHSSQQLGQQLAQLHQHKQAFFGWHIDNTIGSTPQHNDRHHSWETFWRTQRLNKQLEFAKNNGFTGSLQTKGHKLSENLAVFFNHYTPHPSLLHGDLWGGNAAATRQGDPVIFDPACYYGDREADVAMTELFGGFNQHFYAAYKETYPLDAGYSVRKTLYNLYHILNHVNLFGAGYLSQAESMIDRLLAEI
jgi:fructosamine-3-kinase